MTYWADFAAVKQAVSLEAVLRHYQVPGLRRRRDQLQGCCPIHRGRRDDSFRAHLTKNIFQCFACQAHGNVLDFVAAIERCSIREAALRLQQCFGVRAAGLRLYPATASRPKGQLVRKEEGSNLPLRFALTGVERNHPYLVQRGIHPATAAEFGVGFYPGPGLMSGRIVIPIRNLHGQLVAYAGRALDERPPKYKLPPGFRKALEMFNLHRAVAAVGNTVIVVEGYFDCMRVHQAGFPCAVALMGSSLSAAQESGLLHHFARVVLMLDGDVAGRAASEVIVTRLSSRNSVQVVRVPDGSQPDQLSSSTIRQLLIMAGCPNEGAMVKRLCAGIRKTAELTGILRLDFSAKFRDCRRTTNSLESWDGPDTACTGTRSTRRTRCWNCGCGVSGETANWSVPGAGAGSTRPMTAGNVRCVTCPGAS
jgi:DNA primase